MRPWELQQFLFHSSITRKELREYRQKKIAGKRCTVYRNHSFELVEHTIGAYLDYAGLSVEFEYSDYDDSLSFVNLPPTDIILLWLDCSRYSGDVETVERFVQQRVEYLKRQRKERILLVACGASVKDIPGVICWDMQDLQKQLGQKFYDERLEPYSGTKLSAEACTMAAQEIGCRYIPAALRMPLKGLILDMDNTLYSGVLGEDGAQGIRLTKGHHALQEYIADLSAKGFFVSIVTKNDPRDVEELWSAREDFPLKQSMISKIYAGWEEKAVGISQVADFLNIGMDSLLFVDDNIGELAKAQTRLPDLHLLWAQEDAYETRRVLSLYPGLYKNMSLPEDVLRTQDARARAQREALQHESKSEQDYLRSLQVEFDFYINDAHRAERIAELSCKTNQFIFSYARYNLQQVLNLMRNTHAAVVSVHMRDKLSDSGCIAVAVGRHCDEGVLLEECFVSCRALGRGLDETIVLGALRELLSTLNSDRLRITFQRGARNEPAARFVQQHLSQHLCEFSCFSFSNPYPFITTHVHYA